MNCRTAFALVVSVSLFTLPMQGLAQTAPASELSQAERVKIAEDLRALSCRFYGRDDPICKYYEGQAEKERRGLKVEAKR